MYSLMMQVQGSRFQVNKTHALFTSQPAAELDHKTAPYTVHQTCFYDLITHSLSVTMDVSKNELALYQ